MLYVLLERMDAQSVVNIATWILEYGSDFQKDLVRAYMTQGPGK